MLNCISIKEILNFVSQIEMLNFSQHEKMLIFVTIKENVKLYQH